MPRNPVTLARIQRSAMAHFAKVAVIGLMGTVMLQPALAQQTPRRATPAAEAPRQRVPRAEVPTQRAPVQPPQDIQIPRRRNSADAPPPPPSFDRNSTLQDRFFNRRYRRLAIFGDRVLGNDPIEPGAAPLMEDVPSLSSSTAYSLAFWFKIGQDMGGIDRSHVLLEARQRDNEASGFWVTLGADGGLGLGIANKRGLVQKVRSRATDRFDYDMDYNNDFWHQAVVVNNPLRDRQGGTLSLYANGRLEARIEYGAEGFETPEPSSLRLGTGSFGGQEGYAAFRGLLDEATYYPTALLVETIRENMCRTLSPQGYIETSTIRLGGYIWKGAPYCYLGWLSNSFDIISSRPSVLADRPLTSSRTFTEMLRLRSPTLQIYAQEAGTIVSKRNEQRLGNIDISKAQLLDPGTGKEKHGRGFFAASDLFDVSHPRYIQGFSAKSQQLYQKKLGLDGVIVDLVPAGRADVWADDHIISRDGSSGDYGTSQERRIGSTLKFVRGVSAATGLVIAPNTAGFEDVDFKILRTYIETGALGGAWIETFVNHYLEAGKDPEGGSTQNQRVRKLQLALALSEAQKPVIAAMAFRTYSNTDRRRPHDFQFMIASYLVARNSDSLKLHPMPVNPARQMNSLPIWSFANENDTRTEGFSARYLYERLMPYRQFLERDYGTSENLRLIRSGLYVRLYTGSIAVINLTSAPQSLTRFDLPEIAEIGLRRPTDLFGLPLQLPLTMESNTGIVIPY